ncbi:MAG: hypothetical protein JOY60_08340 [Burkholderiaceae bacterium]|nr:hypothetical protein [Roseateles sp.]MBV8469852.1 hypothetical protein [Burkholderiaceae bacterium]
MLRAFSPNFVFSMHPLVHKFLTWNVVLGVVGISTWLTYQVPSRHEQGSTSAVVAYASQTQDRATAYLPSNGAASASARATVLGRR